MHDLNQRAVPAHKVDHGDRHIEQGGRKAGEPVKPGLGPVSRMASDSSAASRRSSSSGTGACFHRQAVRRIHARILVRTRAAGEGPGDPFGHSGGLAASRIFAIRNHDDGQ